jgi:hypothetical protein
MRPAMAAGVLAACALFASPVAAQDPCFGGSTESDAGCTLDAPRWAGQVASLGANGILGGLTAGLLQHFRGGSFSDGFTRGMLGGAASWVGKWIAAESFGGAGLVGRTVSGTGASIVRNASEGVPLLDRLVVPFGPVWLEVRPARRTVHARIDVAGLAWLTYAVIEPELTLDAGASLSAGAPIFRTDGKLLSFGGDAVHAAGATSAGIILLADVPAYGEEYERRSLAHERVHVLQEDQFAIQWTDPVLTRVVSGTRAGRVASRYVAWNLTTEIFRVLGRAIPEHGDRPWELEAIFLAR